MFVWFGTREGVLFVKRSSSGDLIVSSRWMDVIHQENYCGFFRLYTTFSLTLQRFALHQIQIVGLLEDSALEAAAQSLQIAAVNVEHKSRHSAGDGLPVWGNVFVCCE